MSKRLFLLIWHMAEYTFKWLIHQAWYWSKLFFLDWLLFPPKKFRGYYGFVIKPPPWRFSCPSDNLKNMNPINLIFDRMQNWPVRGPKGQKSLIVWISQILHDFVVTFGMHLDDVMGYNTTKAQTDWTRGLNLMVWGDFLQ